ncbi:hypothetical protein KC887_04875 [Candidatus Kaiserbacteria bacterium]|nr:hypothetical protein [Candidatus Kaiserbacteria bacterium]
MFTVWLAGGISHFTSFSVKAETEEIAIARALVTARALWHDAKRDLIRVVAVAQIGKVSDGV